MKVYTAEKDGELVEHVYLCVWDVSWRATEVAIWLGITKCGLEIGLGYVDLVHVEGDRIISTDTRRYYGPILIKFKEAKNEDRTYSTPQLDKHLSPRRVSNGTCTLGIPVSQVC